MKFKLFFSALVLIFSINTAYASFPVERTVSATSTETVSDSVEKSGTMEMSTPAAQSSEKSQGIAMLLALILGGFAAHRWYLKSPIGWNILFILTLGGLGVWWVIDFVHIFTEGYPNADFKSDFF